MQRCWMYSYFFFAIIFSAVSLSGMETGKCSLLPKEETQIGCSSPVYPGVPLAVDSSQKRVVFAPQGGIATIIAVMDVLTDGKFQFSEKGFLFPQGLSSHASPASPPVFIGKTGSIICQQVVDKEGKHASIFSIIDAETGTSCTKKHLRYNQVSVTPSGTMVFLDNKSISTTTINGFISSQFVTIYKRSDKKEYPLLGLSSIAAFSDTCIGTVGPDKKTFEIIEQQKGNTWELATTIKTDVLLEDFTWGKKKKISVVAEDSTLYFYDLAQGLAAEKLKLSNLSDHRAFMADDSLLVCGINGQYPAIAIIGCADLRKPFVIAQVPLWNKSFDVGADKNITQLIVFNGHILVKVTEGKGKTFKSFAVGPVFSGSVQEYLNEVQKSESGK